METLGQGRGVVWEQLWWIQKKGAVVNDKRFNGFAKHLHIYIFI